MRIGIYGGSFNPIHIGHVSSIKYILENDYLDKVLIIPVGVPSHRINNLESGKSRLEMCQLAFKEMDNVEILDIEISSNKKSYTFDTLLKIIDLYGEENEYFEIIGDDSLKYFTSWKNYEDILKLSKLLVLRRDKDFKNNYFEKDSRVIYLNNPYYNFSSTSIRENIKNEKLVSTFLNKEVFEYIKKNKLY